MSMKDDEEDTATYVVVKNNEEQYSILPEYRDVPAGWSVAGPRGHKRLCLDFIERVWTDMRPLSIRAQRDS